MKSYKREFTNHITLSTQLSVFTQTIKTNWRCFVLALVIALLGVPVSFLLRDKDWWISVLCSAVLAVASILVSWFCVSKYIIQKTIERQ